MIKSGDAVIVDKTIKIKRTFRHALGTKIYRRLELVVASSAAPNVTDMPLVQALGPFGGDQTSPTLRTGHISKGRKSGLA